MQALFVMLNNYFHDLAVAFLFASTLLAHLCVREWPQRPPQRLLVTLNRVAIGSLIWIAIGGAVRAWFYRDYEWAPRAGTAQVPALGAKHVLLVAVTAWGLWGLVRLNRLVKTAPEKAS
jgi:hypothetical protein